MKKILIAVPTFENIYPDTFKSIYDLDKGDNEVIFNYKTVLRCGRSYEDDVRVALSTLTRQNKKRIAINTIGISGTIKSGIDKFIVE